MARSRLTYLSPEDREVVHEQAARVLAEIGVGYNTPEAIDLLAGAGAQVERAALTARLPWELIERCLATCAREVRLAGRDPRHDVVVGDGSLTFCADGTATSMLDERTGRREEGSAEWLRRAMRLYDALPEVDYAWPTISARDLDPLMAGLESEVISFANLTKHVQDEGRPLAEEAADRADGLLRTHEVTPLPEGMAAEIDAVIERYARSVGASGAHVSWKGAP